MGHSQLMICGWESKPATRNKEDACQIGMMFQASIVGSNEAMKAAESIIFLGMNRGLWMTLEEHTNTVRRMPQSFRPGIGGGQRSWHIPDISSIGSFDVLLWLLEVLRSIREDDLETGGCRTGLSSIGLSEASWVISSEMWAHMWFFSDVIDRLMMTWDWDICCTKAKKRSPISW